MQERGFKCKIQQMDASEFIPRVAWMGLLKGLKIKRYISNEKPRFKKSEMHGDLPCKKGTLVSASERRDGA